MNVEYQCFWSNLFIRSFLFFLSFFVTFVFFACCNVQLLLCAHHYTFNSSVKRTLLDRHIAPTFQPAIFSPRNRDQNSCLRDSLASSFTPPLSQSWKKKTPINSTRKEKYTQINRIRLIFFCCCFFFVHSCLKCF